MDPLLITSGALTGFIVGLTGVGGGALMTPLLLLVFGVAPMTAVGTDLWFAAATKLAAAPVFQRHSLIDWQIARRLCLGSLPGSVLTLLVTVVAGLPKQNPRYLVAAIAIAACLTAGGLVTRWPRAQTRNPLDEGSEHRTWTSALTVACGALLGIIVTLTSISAGALGAVVLAILYPRRLPPPRLIATDVAHGIPLAAIAGLGHLWLGNVDPWLLCSLLVGSVPAALLGAHLSSTIPDRWSRSVLAVVLLVVGLRLLAASLQ